MESFRLAWFNGSMVDASTCPIRLDDLALTRGYAVFDFFLVVKRVPMFADEHIERLMASAAEMHLHLPFSQVQLMMAVRELIVANECTDAGIRILVTGGNSADGYTLSQPNVFISCMQASPKALPERMAGIRVITWPFKKPFPQIKTTHYVLGIWLKPTLGKQDADDVIYHHDQLVSECTRSNVFVISQKGELITPSENILHGITRKHVLQISHPVYPTRIGQVTCTDLEQAAEIFITSTTQKITPVLALNGRPVSGGSCGPITLHLMQKLQEFEETYLSEKMD